MPTCSDSDPLDKPFGQQINQPASRAFPQQNSPCSLAWDTVHPCRATRTLLQKRPPANVACTYVLRPYDLDCCQPPYQQPPTCQPTSVFSASHVQSPNCTRSLHHATALSPSRMASPAPAHSLVTPTATHHHTCSSPAAPRLIAAHCQQFWSTLKPCWNHVKRPGVLAIKESHERQREGWQLEGSRKERSELGEIVSRMFSFRRERDISLKRLEGL